MRNKDCPYTSIGVEYIDTYLQVTKGCDDCRLRCEERMLTLRTLHNYIGEVVQQLNKLANALYYLDKNCGMPVREMASSVSDETEKMCEIQGLSCYSIEERKG